MLMDVNMIAAETGAVEYLPDDVRAVIAPTQPSHEARTFDLPKSIWRVMFLSYAVFFLALTLALGADGGAMFMIVVSVGYALMYFGTARVMNGVGASERPKTTVGDIDTATGKLGYGAAFAQILTVPLVIAFFGCTISTICALALR